MEYLIVVHGSDPPFLVEFFITHVQLVWPHVLEQAEIQECLVVNWMRVEHLFVDILQDVDNLIDREDHSFIGWGWVHVVIDLEAWPDHSLYHHSSQSIVELVELGLRELRWVVPIVILDRVADVEVKVARLCIERVLELVLNQKLRACDLINSFVAVVGVVGEDTLDQW